MIGEVGDIASAQSAVRLMRPRVVLLDVQLPDSDGIEAAADLCDPEQVCDVVLVSSRDRSAYGDRVDQSAARGFIRKPDLTAGGVLALLDLQC